MSGINEVFSAKELEQIDRETVFHASTHLRKHASGDLGSPRIITSGKGIRIRDVYQNELIDGFAGLYCVNVGYGREEIAEKIFQQAKELSYYHTYVGHSNRPVIELSRKIIDMAPEGMNHIYYGMSGSDANETQIKIVWYYHNVLGNPKKKKIISRNRGYHGSGIMTGSLTGLPVFHNHFNLPLQDYIKHTVTPHFYREASSDMSETEFSKWCGEQLEQLIIEEGPESIAAFIGEPVLGTGGIIPPPENYWLEIQAVLKKYDILLIADEVITAFGRIGHNFGGERYGIKPDLITIAKGMTSAYMPLSGVIVSDKVWSVLEEGTDRFGPFGHGWTYSGHALGAAAALANFEIIERENIVAHALEIGNLFQQMLAQRFYDHPMVGEVRGVGLLGALEFVANKATKQRFQTEDAVGPRVASACLENGLILRAMPHGDILGFAPPLIVNESELIEIIDRAESALNRVTDQLIGSGKLITKS